MPIRVFKCEKCGHEVELLQSMNDGPPSPCDKCGADDSMVQVLTSGYKIRMPGAENMPLGRRYT